MMPFGDEGLPGAFYTVSLNSMMGHRPFDTPPIQKELNEQYEKILLDLLSLPYPNSDMPIIRLDGDALDVL